MDNIANKIKSFFDEDEWKYHYNAGKRIFETGIVMGNALGNVKINIILEETLYNVYSVLNNTAEKKILC